MPLKKRGEVYYFDITTPSGRRIRKSTGLTDYRLAQEYHDRYKAELWKEAAFGDKPRRTWKEAVIRWCKEKAHLKSIEESKYQFKWLRKYLDELYLDQINRDMIDYITDERLKGNVSNSTVNRTLETLRTVLRTARDEWEWIDKVPKVRMLVKAEGRTRWLTRQEAQKLLAELPEHLNAMMRFTLATGLRQGNVKGLKWEQVDLSKRRAWIHAYQSKNKKAIGVPLNSDAVIVLREQQGKHPEFVFTYNGEPITQVNTKAWRKALKRAGINDFRWHDLRHTWASWMLQETGVPLYALQELGGWKTADMVKRYAHLCPDHLTQYVDKLSSPKVVNNPLQVTNGAQR